jgi:hypothetical protein
MGPHSDVAKTGMCLYEVDPIVLKIVLRILNVLILTILLE